MIENHTCTGEIFHVVIHPENFRIAIIRKRECVDVDLSTDTPEVTPNFFFRGYRACTKLGVVFRSFGKRNPTCMKYENKKKRIYKRILGVPICKRILKKRYTSDIPNTPGLIECR